MTSVCRSCDGLFNQSRVTPKGCGNSLDCRLYIRGSKAKEKRKKGSGAKGHGCPYITLTGHVASFRPVCYVLSAKRHSANRPLAKCPVRNSYGRPKIKPVRNITLPSKKACPQALVTAVIKPPLAEHSCPCVPQAASCYASIQTTHPSTLGGLVGLGNGRGIP